MLHICSLMHFSSHIFITMTECAKINSLLFFNYKNSEINNIISKFFFQKAIFRHNQRESFSFIISSFYKKFMAEAKQTIFVATIRVILLRRRINAMQIWLYFSCAHVCVRVCILYSNLQLWRNSNDNNMNVRKYVSSGLEMAGIARG